MIVLLGWISFYGISVAHFVMSNWRWIGAMTQSLEHFRHDAASSNTLMNPKGFHSAMDLKRLAFAATEDFCR